jgi:hypothetical protein
VGVPVVVEAGIVNVPSALISGTGPDAMEKFGGTLSVVGVIELPTVLVGSALPSALVSVLVVLSVGASDGVTCGSGETHGTVLFPESVGVGALASGLLLSVGYEPSSVVVAVAFVGIESVGSGRSLESVGSGRSLESVGVGSDKGSRVE